MLLEGNGLNVIRLQPEEVERLLVAEYGDKLADINVARMEKRKQQRTKSADYYQRKNRNNNLQIEGQK